MLRDFRNEFVDFVRTRMWHAKYVTSFTGLLKHSLVLISSFPGNC